MTDLVSTRKKIIDLLKTIYDPEIPVNIWDLGLVYGVDVVDSTAIVTYTLTSPNCPAIDLLPQQMEETISNLAEINEVKLNLVWDPVWSKDLMTEEARIELGMY